MWSPDPPKSLAPERLFRLLLSARPSLPIPFRFAGLEQHTLTVGALPAQSFADSEDATSHLSGERRTSWFWAHVISKCVLVDGQCVFDDAADVLGLPETELTALRRDVESTLSIVGPTYTYSRWPTWHAALVKGADHRSNAGAHLALSAAYEAGGYRLISRPDRYFGMPLRHLLDGHWMVYLASRALYESRYK